MPNSNPNPSPNPTLALALTLTLTRQQLASYPPEAFEAARTSLRETETRAVRAEEA